MSTYLLIHGAWHGAWCWTRLIPYLKTAGHSVIAPDLPGHGDDTTPLAKVSMAAYVAATITEMDKLDEPVILVGHSMGGIVITQAAELRPDRIKALVYLTAFLPRNGQSLAGMEEQNPHSAVPPQLVPTAEGMAATIRESKITDLFYHDCLETDIQYAKQRLCPQPLELLNTPVSISPDNYGRVPRYYIVCTEDRALRIDYQEQMIKAAPGTCVLTLPASHSPFFSMPEKLAEILTQIAG